MSKKIKKDELIELIKQTTFVELGVKITKSQAYSFYYEIIRNLVAHSHANGVSIPLGDYGSFEVRYVPVRKIKTPLMENFKRTVDGYKITFKNKMKKEKLKEILDEQK